MRWKICSPAMSSRKSSRAYLGTSTFLFCSPPNHFGMKKFVILVLVLSTFELAGVAARANGWFKFCSVTVENALVESSYSLDLVRTFTDPSQCIPTDSIECAMKTRSDDSFNRMVAFAAALDVDVGKKAIHSRTKPHRPALPTPTVNMSGTAAGRESRQIMKICLPPSTTQEGRYGNRKQKWQVAFEGKKLLLSNRPRLPPGHQFVRHFAFRTALA